MWAGRGMRDRPRPRSGRGGRWCRGWRRWMRSARGDGSSSMSLGMYRRMQRSHLQRRLQFDERRVRESAVPVPGRHEMRADVQRHERLRLGEDRLLFRCRMRAAMRRLQRMQLCAGDLPDLGRLLGSVHGCRQLHRLEGFMRGWPMHQSMHRQGGQHRELLVRSLVCLHQPMLSTAAGKS